ncbi:helix-turn-helix transcriptional regulator [Geobacillus sp. TFV-3]|uniref:helix-turn-helix transcriptional regulator n=1 Tax=Geobacillus sp. TFV-3 TaxID=1897059 RepID=UPI0013571D52|nr:helix-turn-helix transcriptional regulator [Geobacillus sp. TFV-3]KAF0993630.1 hypothetical protein BJQ97_00238 [Geobacillus sp. TFV-3]
MLAMPEMNRIRKLREKKGLSIAEISRETGYNSHFAPSRRKSGGFFHPDVE